MTTAAGPVALALPGPARAGRSRGPRGQVLLLIACVALLHLAFAAMLGLGIDESYMVAAGRTLAAGYYDHPPLAWWLAWAAAHLAGTDDPFVVRLPFILLSAVSTWLLYDLTARLFTARAGVWAAAAFSVAPVFGVTTGTWVLPDGPLDCALLAAALSLSRAVEADRSRAWRWWLACGTASGLALLSKYTAFPVIAGALLYLVTAPRHRHWLGRPQPYAAGLLAALCFAPVIAWNAANGWVSFAFQGGRAGAHVLHPFAPVAAFAGEALFLLPWLWAALMVAAWQALRAGPAAWRVWLPLCLGTPTILLFAVVGIWSRKPVMFHWAAPGYLMLLPLLGAAAERARRLRPRLVMSVSAGSALLVAGGAFTLASEVCWNWLPAVLENFAPGTDPDIDAVDWTSLRTTFARRDLLAGVDAVGAMTWHDTGKIDYALGDSVPVLCLAADCRQYGLRDSTEFLGGDILVAAAADHADRVREALAPLFAAVEDLAPVQVQHAGRDALPMALFIGRGWRGPPPPE